MFDKICYEDRCRVVREMLNRRVEPGSPEEFKDFMHRCMDILLGVKEAIPNDMERYVMFPRKP